MLLYSYPSPSLVIHDQGHSRSPNPGSWWWPPQREGTNQGNSLIFENLYNRNITKLNDYKVSVWMSVNTPPTNYIHNDEGDNYNYNKNNDNDDNRHYIEQWLHVNASSLILIVTLGGRQYYPHLKRRKLELGRANPHTVIIKLVRWAVEPESQHRWPHRPHS